MPLDDARVDDDYERDNGEYRRTRDSYDDEYERDQRAGDDFYNEQGYDDDYDAEVDVLDEDGYVDYSKKRYTFLVEKTEAEERQERERREMEERVEADIQRARELRKGIQQRERSPPVTPPTVNLPPRQVFNTPRMSDDMPPSPDTIKRLAKPTFHTRTLPKTPTSATRPSPPADTFVPPPRQRRPRPLPSAPGVADAPSPLPPRRASPPVQPPISLAVRAASEPLTSPAAKSPRGKSNAPVIIPARNASHSYTLQDLQRGRKGDRGMQILGGQQQQFLPRSDRLPKADRALLKAAWDARDAGRVRDPGSISNRDTKAELDEWESKLAELAAARTTPSLSRRPAPTTTPREDVLSSGSDSSSTSTTKKAAGGQTTQESTRPRPR
ncbi:hypothetical protein HK101_006704, partial [Irineochytrium annulatum]